MLRTQSSKAKAFRGEQRFVCGLEVARPARIELATARLEGGCSIQLSYGRSEADILTPKTSAGAAL